MSAGIAGLTRVLTQQVLADLNACGDRLREGVNDIAARQDVALQVSGRGSMMTIHPAAEAIVSSAGLSRAQALVKELIFFELLSAGLWTARRGMMTLSLPITDQHCRAFLIAFDEILATHLPLLRRYLGPVAGTGTGGASS